MSNNSRIGVYICDCGGEIPKVIDIDNLQKKVLKQSGVVLMEKVKYGCNSEGGEYIKIGIQNNSLDKVVILGCTPRLMEKKFQQICADSGLNPSLLEIVNLRDQCAWVHQKEPDKANEKAWDLTRIGITRSSYLSPVEVIKAEIHPKAVVIGAGISGMTAAISLANHGIPVALLEREVELGGLVKKFHHLSTSLENGKETVKKLVKQIKKSDNITVLTQVEVKEVSGSYGNFKLKVKTKQKLKTVRCGVIILATGARELKPEGLYGYGENEKVITQSELGNIIVSKTGLDGLKKVAMIQCAGARNSERSYCGRICCMTAVNNAILIKKKKPSIKVTLLHRDIISDPGPDIQMLEEAQQLGIEFIRIDEETPLKTTKSQISGRTNQGVNIALPFDLAVLSTPLIPHESSIELAKSFCLPVDEFGFIPDTLPNLKVNQYIEPCIHVVGSARWPCLISEGIHQAYSRTSRLSTLIRQKEVLSNLNYVKVNVDSCRGCGDCFDWCPFDVPQIRPLNSSDPVSFIDPFLCKGCGSCVVHCPSGAAKIDNLDDNIFYRMIESALENRKPNATRTLAFLCEWSGYAIMDLVGVKRKSLPREIIPIRIPCAGRISTGIILHAFLYGADGVMVCACEEGDCHYRSGNRHCSTVVEETGNILNLLGIEKERFLLKYVNSTDVNAFLRIMKGFHRKIESLEGPFINPIYSEDIIQPSQNRV